MRIPLSVVRVEAVLIANAGGTTEAVTLVDGDQSRRKDGIGNKQEVTLRQPVRITRQLINQEYTENVFRLPSLIELFTAEPLIKPYSLEKARAPMSPGPDWRVIATLNGQVSRKPHRHVHTERLSDMQAARRKDAPTDGF